LLHGHLDEYLSLNPVVLGDRGQRKPLINSYDVIMTSSIKVNTPYTCTCTCSCGYTPLGDFTIVSLSSITFPRGSFDLEVRYLLKNNYTMYFLAYSIN
jgi:hypothetical protein